MQARPMEGGAPARVLDRDLLKLNMVIAVDVRPNVDVALLRNPANK